MQRENWTISQPRVETTASGNRLTATVCGQDVWFEGRGFELRPAPEAFASVFAQHAQAVGATLELPGPVDPVWRSGMAKLAGLYTDWWGYPAFSPVVAELKTDTPADRADPDPANAGRLGQCFTGGVDSFYSLLHGRWPCHGLIYVHGLDINVDDHNRMDTFRPTLHRVAEQMGIEVFEIATNLRTVLLFKTLSWECTYGSAVAAAGLLLQHRLDGMVIPASWQRNVETLGHGSHWDSDPLHSTSGFSVIHDDAIMNRRDRVEHIANDTLAQQHLRVCWENRAASGNCSSCEKCLRTMTGLDAVGRLQDFETFDHSQPLITRIEGIEALRGYSQPKHWQDLQRRHPDPAVKRAIDRLLIRSRWLWSDKWTTRQYHRVRRCLGYLLAG